MSSLLLSLFISITLSHAKEFPLKVFYIEDLIEKEVNWPAYIEPLEDLSSGESPKLKVYIGIPELIKVKPVPQNVTLLNTCKHKSPFKSSQQIKDFLSLETRERSILIKLLKEKSDGSHVPVVLKLTFDSSHSFVGIAKDCKRLYEYKSIRFEGFHPFLIHMDCPNERSAIIKGSRGLKFRKTGSSDRLDQIKVEIKKASPGSPVHISASTYSEKDSGTLKIELLSKADVLDAFEPPRLSSLKRTPDQVVPKFSRVRAMGAYVSKLDPEVFANLSFRKANSIHYFNFVAQSTIPSFFQGSSIRHAMDYSATVTAHRTIHLENREKRVLLGGGLEAMKISSFENNPSYIALGPKVHLGFHKAYEWSDRFYLGIFASHSILSNQFFKMSNTDHVSELELRMSMVQADGRLLEPKVTYQIFDLKHFNGRDVSTIKLGLGVRF